MIKSRNTGLILSYIKTFLSMISGLFLSSYLIKQLGSTNYGIYQTMSSFANYLVLLEFGTGTVLSRNLVASRIRKESQEQNEKNISTIWTIMSALLVGIFAVSIIFFFSIPSIYASALTAAQIKYSQNIFVFIVIFLMSSFVLQTLNGLALAFEHYSFSSIIAIIKLVTRTVLLVVLVFIIKNAIVIAIVDAAISLFLSVFCYFYCRKTFKVKINFKNFDKAILKSSLPLCLAIFLQSIVTQSNNTVGKFILGIVSGPNAVSLYSISLYVYSIFSSLATIPVSLYVPQVTKNVLAGFEGLSLTKTLVQPCRLIVLVCGTILFGFTACGKQFITILYGQEYLLAWLMSIILIVPSFLNMSNAVVLNVLDIKNKRLARSYILMITTAINLALTFFGIQYWGIIAAAAATGLSTLLQVIILNTYYQKVIGIKVIYLFSQSYKGIVIFQIIGAAFGYWVGTLINNIYFSFLAAGATYIMLAFGGFLLFGKNEYECAIIGKYLKGFQK